MTKVIPIVITINHQIIELTAQKLNISSENVTFTMEDRRGRSDSVKVFVNFMYQNIHKNLEENLQKIFNKGTSEDLAKIVDGLYTLKKLLSN